MRISRALIALPCVFYAYASTDDDFNAGLVDMVGHSFKAPLNFGATVSMDSHVVLLPALSEKHGFFFHSKPIKTDHFLTTIDLDVIKPSSSETSMDEAFAFWFVAGNVSEPYMRFASTVTENHWKNGLKQIGFGMNGIIPASFSGFGLVFTPPGDITLITSDGSQPSSSFDNLNLRKDSINNFDFRKPGVKLTVSCNRNRGVVSVYAYAPDSVRGQVTVITKNLPPSGYMGFTGYTGAGVNPFAVNIRQMRTINLDHKSKAGEDSLKASLSELEKKLETKNLHVDDLLMEDDEDEDPEDQIQDVNKAISIISEYLADTRFRDQSMMQKMMDVRSQADDLEEMINSLRMEIRYTFNGKGAKNSLQQGIKGLEELIQLHAEENQNINVLKTKLSHFASAVENEQDETRDEVISKLAKVNEELENEVVQANSTANIVIALFGFVVLVIGVMLYQKMKQYEKKHFL